MDDVIPFNLSHLRMGFFLFQISRLEVSEHQQAKPPLDSSFLDLEKGSGVEPSFAPVAVDQVL